MRSSPQPNIYPTADGWCPPTWPTQEDESRREEEERALPKRSLVKRTALITAAQAERFMDASFMEAGKYSLQVFPLREDTHFSGADEDRGFVCWVYYQPRDEQAVIRAWQSVGINVTEGEREVVDPEASIINEQHLVASQKQMCFFNVYEWEVVKPGQKEKEYKDGPYWP